MIAENNSTKVKSHFSNSKRNRHEEFSERKIDCHYKIVVMEGKLSEKLHATIKENIQNLLKMF